MIYLLAAILYLSRTEFIFLALLGRRWALAIGSAALCLWLMTGNIVSPNSPAVFYISLGQLPHNAWGIEYSDSTALKMVPEAWYRPAYFRAKSIRAIVEHPAEYAKKCAYNTWRVIHDGVWAGVQWKPLSVLTQIIYGVIFWIALGMWIFQRYGKWTEAERFVLVLILGVVGFQVLGQQMARHMTVLYLPVLGLCAEADRRQFNNYMEV